MGKCMNRCTGVIEEADQRPCRISGRRINPIRLKQGRLL